MSEQRSDVTTARDDENRRFSATVDGRPAGVIDYAVDDAGNWVLMHTVVAPAAEGHGVGSALVQRAIADARSAGVRIVPQCTFVQGYLERHPADADIVA